MSSSLRECVQYEGLRGLKINRLRIWHLKSQYNRRDIINEKPATGGIPRDILSIYILQLGLYNKNNLTIFCCFHRYGPVREKKS